RDPRHPSQHPDAQNEGVRAVRNPLPPLRVEQALRLLPELEVLLPLRSLILAASRPEEQAQWASHGPYLTVGTRSVEPAELRQRAVEAPAQGTGHVGPRS